MASRKAARKPSQKTTKKKAAKKESISKRGKHPRHSLDKALRIPQAILDQNAGKVCSDKEAAGFLGLKLSGALLTEIASAIKYGLIERPNTGKLALTDRAKKILKPQSQSAATEGKREAVLAAPVISDIYKHYRGENLPDQQFFDNALTDNFGVSASDLSELKTILLESLRSANLLDESTPGKIRLLDVSQQVQGVVESAEQLRKVTKTANISSTDSCFVIMPFAPPLGSHYTLIYEKAILKAGLKPVRADADIFATGKIMDQVWTGINAAKVLVAELTSRNPNVFYELGIAHTLRKPVVLVSSNELDVPFDVRHIRVIYYDTNDPFWGDKLLNKVAENIVSAITNPEEAIFKSNSQ